MYSEKEMAEFGANRGQELYNAIMEAAIRGVRVRIIMGKLGGDHWEMPEEMVALEKLGNVYIQIWDGNDWYGGGILHQKLWIFDDHTAYVGSANTDWKSLSQVMELGIVSQQPVIVLDFQNIFHIWWKWSCPKFPKHFTAEYFSQRYQMQRKVPSWSKYIDTDKRTPYPFSLLPCLHNDTHPIYSAGDQNTTSSTFIAAAPLEVAYPGRTFDEDALVYTIKSATTKVDISVMDFQSSSVFALQDAVRAPVWWPALTDAILSVIYSKAVHVRMLISYWQHSSNDTLRLLLALQASANACKSMYVPCQGALSIKLFKIPGWNITSTSTDKMPFASYTRVNHAKYILSDTRVNIGTSNMQWGYFYTTAGISLNTNDTTIHRQVSNIFDRNWQSHYANPLAI